MSYATSEGDGVREVRRGVVEYDSWGAFVRAARVSHGAAHHTYEGEWYGHVASWDEALTLAERGWPEGMAHVRNVAMPAVETHAARHVPASHWEWDVTGAAWSLGEYLSGAPECWLAARTEETRPVVRLVVNTTVSAGVPADVMRRRGGGVVALTLALQAAGFVVDVRMVVGVRPAAGDSWLSVALADTAGGPLDVDRMLYALAHPAATRAMGYRVGACNVGALDDNYLMWPTSSCPWAAEADVFFDRTHLDDADWSNDAAVRTWLERVFADVVKRKG